MNRKTSADAASRRGRTALFGILVCVLVSVFFVLVPPVYVLQETVIIWPIGGLYTSRWGLLTALILCAGGSHLLVRLALACENLGLTWCRWIRILEPLSWLPLGGAVALLADRLPITVVSNALFFIPVFMVSMVISRMIAEVPLAPSVEGETRRWAWRILAGATLSFSAIGCYLSATTGEHVGDEGHYLIQAKSLYFDHDLDIKNNFLSEGRDPATVDLHSIHVSPQSKGGHWYSWHPHGLSVVLAPFWPGGMPLRQFILGLISGTGCVGMFLLSRRMGASRRSSLVAILGLAGSVYWALYSARSLPEVFGASLLIWVFWAIAAQTDKPWTSTVVVTACSVCLPFVHFRFLPLSLMGASIYGLFGLCSKGSRGHKIIRLSVFSLFCLMGAVVFFGIQRGMFESGASYPVSEVLFSYPSGAWAVLADSRGVTSIFPLFMWLAGAWIALLFTHRDKRWFALGLGATFIACLLTSATNASYTGGSSIPGRYALVVVPLLIPAAALMLDRASPLARWWFVFLGLMSPAILIVVLVRLSEIGRGFVRPVQAATDHPLLQGLFAIRTTFLEGPPQHVWVTSFYVAAGILTVVWLLIQQKRRTTESYAAIALVVFAGIVACRVGPPAVAMPYNPSSVAAELNKLDLDRAMVISRNSSSRPEPLLQVSRVVFRDTQNPERRTRITSRDLGLRRVGALISQPRLEPNDWAGRGFRWTTLTAPFSPKRGLTLIHIEGRIEGTATVVFALREGGHTLFEGPLKLENGKVEGNFGVHLKGKSGHLYLLARLDEGVGEFFLDDLSWSPYSDRLLRMANLQLPNSTAIIRQ